MTEENATENRKTIISPAKLAHVALITSKLEEIVAWYSTILNAKVVFDNGSIAFLSYDEEHHRIAIIGRKELVEQRSDNARVHHAAFTFESLSVLLENYARLKSLGVRPVLTINHGPTTSIYYEDPDGNNVEFQVENFDSVEESTQYFFSEDFAINPIGVEFDADEMLQRVRAGEDEATLKKRPKSGPRDTDSIQ